MAWHDDLANSLGNDPLNVEALAGAGEKAVDAMASGAGRAVGTLYDTGVSMSESLAQGILEPLGQTGAQIVQMGVTLAHGISTVVGSAFGAVGDVVQGIFHLATIAGGAIGGVLGGIGGMVLGGLPGAELGAVIGTAVGAIIGKVVSTVADTIGSVIGRIGEAFGALGDALSQAAQSFLSVLQDVMKSATEFSNHVLNIRNYTGLSTESAMGLQQRLTVLGAGAGAGEQMFSDVSQNPVLFAARARMFNLPGYQSPEFVPRMAEEYQHFSHQGWVGQMRARNMMDLMGVENPQMMRLANMNPARIRDQLDWQSGVQKQMGMDPKAIAEVGENMALLTERFEYFGEMLKTRFLQELLPLAEKILTIAGDYLSKNTSAIVDGIKHGVEWLYTTLPKLLLTAASTGLRAFASFAGGISDFFKSFQAGDGGFLEMVGNFLEGIDWITTGFSGLMKFLGFFGLILYDLEAMVESIIATFFNAIKTIGSYLPTLALNALGLNDIADAINNFELTPMPLVNPMDAYTSGAFPSTDYRGSFENFRNSSAITTGTNALDNVQKSALDTADSVDAYNTSLGTVDDRKDDYQKNVLDTLQEGNQNTKGIKNALDSVANGGRDEVISGDDVRRQLELMLVKGLRRARTRG